jgi:hypothetical protein
MRCRTGWHGEVLLVSGLARSFLRESANRASLAKLSLVEKPFGDLINPIRPSVKAVAGQHGDKLANVTKANVLAGVKRLEGLNPILTPIVMQRELKVAPGPRHGSGENLHECRGQEPSESVLLTRPTRHEV